MNLLQNNQTFSMDGFDEKPLAIISHSLHHYKNGQFLSYNGSNIHIVISVGKKAAEEVEPT